MPVGGIQAAEPGVQAVVGGEEIFAVGSQGAEIAAPARHERRFAPQRVAVVVELDDLPLRLAALPTEIDAARVGGNGRGNAVVATPAPFAVVGGIGRVSGRADKADVSRLEPVRKISSPTVFSRRLRRSPTGRVRPNRP